MALDSSYARAELRQESWEQRVNRLSKETHDLVVATRVMIEQSRKSLARADEALRDRQ